MNNVDLVIIDLKHPITEISRYEAIYSLFKVYPLNDIISTILSLLPYDDNGELVWLDFESRLDNNMNLTDKEYLDFFNEKLITFGDISIAFDLIAQILDEYIRAVFPDNKNYENYIIKNLVNSTCIVMRTVCEHE